MIFDHPLCDLCCWRSLSESHIFFSIQDISLLIVNLIIVGGIKFYLTGHMFTEKEDCNAVYLYSLFRTTLGIASRFNS